MFGVTMRPFSHFFIAVRDGTARQNDRLGVDRVVIGLALGLNADNGAGLIRNETFCRRARERCHAELVALILQIGNKRRTVILAFIFTDHMPSRFFPWRHADDVEFDAVLHEPIDIVSRPVNIVAHHRNIDFIHVHFTGMLKGLFASKRVAAQTVEFGFDSKDAFGKVRSAADEEILLEKHYIGTFFSSLNGCRKSCRASANNDDVRGKRLLCSNGRSANCCADKSSCKCSRQNASRENPHPSNVPQQCSPTDRSASHE